MDLGNLGDEELIRLVEGLDPSMYEKLAAEIVDTQMAIERERAQGLFMEYVKMMWWKRNDHSPTLRDIAYVRGKAGLGNTKEIVDRLVKLGVLKRLERRRSIRPVYINFRTIE